MDKFVFVDCSAYMYSLIATAYENEFSEVKINQGDPDNETLHRLMQDATGILVGHTRIPNDLLMRAHALKSIVFLGTGASSYIDLDFAEDLSITVHTIKNYANRAVAEHAIALMFDAARQISVMNSLVRAGRWEGREGIQLQDRLLGIVGLGAIGREVADLGCGLGMRVAVWSRSDTVAHSDYRRMSLSKLFSCVDVVSLHLAETDETRGLIGEQMLSLMKPGSLLINTARGSIVDEPALLKALTSGCIGHAALDVFKDEPLCADHPFLSMDNVTLTPHVAFKTREACDRLLGEGIRKLRESI